MSLILHRNNKFLKVILFIASPTQYLPPILPLWAESVRIGQNYDYVKVSFNRRAWNLRKRKPQAL